jgi:hypothetical protein
MDTIPSREGSIQTVKFNGNNFNIWKYSLFIRLREHDLVPIVEGTRPKPAVNRVAGEITNQGQIDAWIKDDNLAIHYLFNTCLEEQQSSLLTCETSNAIWTSVTNQYQRNSIERRHAIQQQFLNLTFNAEQGVRAHVERIKLLSKELTDAGCPTDEGSICNKILTSLPDAFVGFFTAWESTSAADRTLANLTTRLCNEEERNKRRRVNGSSSSDNQAFWGGIPNSPQSSAPGPSHRSSSNTNSRPYPPQGGRRGSGGRNVRFESSNQGNPRRNGNCNYCDIYGHWEKECRFKKEDEATRANTRANSAAYEKRDLSANFVQLDLAGPNVGLVAHSACLSPRALSYSDFYLDSGATQHMSHQRSLFTNFQPIQPGLKWISGIGQSRVEILGTGNIIITSLAEGAHQTITLLDALYAPSLGINLVSVGSITAKGGEIRFSKSHVNVVRDGNLLFTGERVGETLYRLNTSNSSTRNASPDPVVASLSALPKSSPNSIQEWHQRLAHLNYQTIIKMEHSDAVVGLDLPTGAQLPAESCHDCAMGKMKRTLFNLSSTPKSSRIGVVPVPQD